MSDPAPFVNKNGITFTRIWSKDETVAVPVPPVTLIPFPCRCLVKERAGAYRQCRKTAEFWMPTPWGAEVMVCFTHVNANEVRLVK